MRRLLLLLLVLWGLLPDAVAQNDSVVHRIILIGDAGQKNKAQAEVIRSASSKVLQQKTTTVFLGDNIYSRGIGLPGAKDAEDTRQTLRSQFVPFRENGASVFFIPGNHDWDKMGPLGLAKIKQQWQYLNDQQDSLLKLFPPDGCPDPIAVKLPGNVTLIMIDTEWWLYPYSTRNPDAECGCVTKQDVIYRLQDLLYENRNRFILLAGHHPFLSYGVHGGYYSWKDHIFPLRAANRSLYIPLPVIGTLYPTLRRLFSNPEDIRHPLYREMATEIKNAFGKNTNWAYISGHDHGLQYNVDSPFVQVVSGGGSRQDYVRQGKHSLYAYEGKGYVIADILTNSKIRFSYYALTDTGISQEFAAERINSPAPEIEAQLGSVSGDSIDVRLYPAYDSVSRFHRKLFGENYRKEYAALTRLPVFRISELKGGLTPTERGGGMQSKSVRLEDGKGNEYALRSVLKVPDVVLPSGLRETFARDWVNDAMSAQHPFSALIVPPIAAAVNVPHAKPVIGYVAPDPALGPHNYTFANTVALLEERNPIGKTDNTPKMLANLAKDNDDRFDGEMFFRAQMLDLLIGDWDRHEDQWRWRNPKAKGKDKFYMPVPRDRDQALHLTEGFFPRLASRQWLLPTLQGFGPQIANVRYSLFKSRFLDAFPDKYFSKERWDAIVNQFVASVTDSVIEAAVGRLPMSAYQIRGKKLIDDLKKRRDAIPAAMESYYRFNFRVVDIRLSNKNEKVEILQGDDSSIWVCVRKINKDGILKDTLMYHNFVPDFTREIRIYLSEGMDSLVVNYTRSPIKLRIVGGKGDKEVNMVQASTRVKWYGPETGTHFSGNPGLIRKYISNDSAHTAFVATDPYNIWMPLTSVGINIDDGLILGAGFQYTHKRGFRKLPYTHRQELLAGHSFSTRAYRIRYTGEWLNTFGKADFVMQAIARAPNNTINYFGQGNETDYVKVGNYKRFYRARFTIYQADPAIRWDNRKGNSLTIGPSVQYYRFDVDDSAGRYIGQYGTTGTYDSASFTRPKLHGGIALNLKIDKRNNPVLTSWGYQFNLQISALEGLNSTSRAFARISPEVILYKMLTPKGTLVLADRLGGAATVGHMTFYQSAFLGGQGNLVGYRQFRFAGEHCMYNNLELRMKIADIANYILPGQLGLAAFHDIGRVWAQGERSKKWHNGFGGGIYFSPASLAVFSFVMGRSNEGWYPYFTMGTRF